MRKPWRAPGSRYGACDIDSMPPPTASSRSPARTAWSIIPTARTLDAHTLLIVSEVTSIGIPASICACRLGIWPCPACSTVPITTCSTCSGATSARCERLADRYAAQMRGGERGEAPAQLADRRAGAAQDHGSRHAAESINVRARCDVTATTDAPTATSADTIVVGVFEDEGIAHDHDGVLQALVDSGEAKRGLRKLAVTHAGGRRYIVAGLGGRSEFDPERARVAAAGVVGRAKELGTQDAVLGGPAPRLRRARGRRWSRARCWPAYAFREYKSGSDDDDGLAALVLSAHHDVSAPAAARRRWSPGRSTPPATSRTGRRTT